MRDHKLYLDDIVEAIEKIEKYTSKVTFRGLQSNSLVVDGVVRNLEIIGEAVKRLPLHIKGKYPDIEWKKIAGLRDVLAHEYFGIDLEVVWDIVSNKLPVLKKQMAKILKDSF
jgi:uncharacterized protein with HEPN domain